MDLQTNEGQRQEDRVSAVTYLIIGWSVFVFLNFTFQPQLGNAGAARFGYVSEPAVYKGAIWGLVTMAFVHVEPLHLIFNLYWLYILGGTFERKFGSGLFLLFVLGSAFVSSGLEFATGNLGIGLSGVGYALFGFGFATRHRCAEFARLVTDQVAFLFLGWGVFCVVATMFHWMNVANVAHIAGFALGVTIGGAVTNPKLRPLLGSVSALLALASIVPLFWNPLSLDWTAEQAYRAHVKHDYARAARLYQRALQLGGDEAWAWNNLAQIYLVQNDVVRFSDALEHLRAVDASAAKAYEEALQGSD